MPCMTGMDVIAVVLALLAAPRPVHSQVFRIEAVLAGACSAEASCGDSRDRVVTETSGDLSITLAITWVNGWSVFQVYSFIKSLHRGSAQLLLIDERLTRLVELPGQSSVIIFPEIFRFKKHQPQPESDNDCCDDFDEDDLDVENTTDNVNNCLAWPDSAAELRAIIQHLKWKEFILVYDHINEQEAKAITDNMTNCQFFMHVIDKNISPPTLLNSTSSLTSDWNPSKNYEFESKDSLKIAEDEQIRDFLQTIYDDVPIQKNIQVVLVCTLDNIKRILTLANRFDKENIESTAMHFRSRWLLSLPMESSLDSGVTNFLESLDNLDNVAIIDSRHTRYTEDININTNMDDLLDELMLRAAELKGQIDLTSIVSQILQNRNERCVDTQVNTLYFGGQEGRYLNTVAMVNTAQEVVRLSKYGIFPNIQFGLNKRNLTVAVVQWEPFVNKSDHGYQGISIELLTQLEAVLNFTAHIIEPADGEWGNRLQNDTFTGLLGQLQRREADMVVSPLAMIPKRERVLDFAFPFYTDYTTVMLKMPDSNRSKWLTLIQPFKWHVHLAIVISLFAVAVLITILERHNPYYRSEKSAFHNVLDSIWYMYGTLLTQGGEDLPTSTTGLTLVSFWLMFSVVVASTYSGNLIAFLTVTIDSPPFDSLQSMLDQDVYKWGTVGTIGDLDMGEFQYQEHLLKQTQDPIKIAVWEQIKIFNQSDPSVLSPHVDDHLAKVNCGDYAFVGDKSIIDNWANGICHLRTIKENFFPRWYAIGLVNNSPYTNMVSKEVIKVADLGLYQLWKSRWSTKIRYCQGNLVTDATAISLLDVQSAFYMICIGVVLSGLTLAAERLRAYVVARRGARHYSFSMSSLKSHNEVTLNKHVKITSDGSNINDSDNNEAIICVEKVYNEK